MEAVTALIDLGVPISEIMPKQYQQQIDWMPDVLDALRSTNKPDLASSPRRAPCFYHFSAPADPLLFLDPTPIPEPTLERYGDHHQIILAAAAQHLRHGDLDSALIQYNRIRQLDRRLVSDLDGLAWILLKRGDVVSLMNLSTDLMKAAPSRHEGWAASAAYFHLKGQTEWAQDFIARATALGPLSPFTWLVRGEISSASTHSSAISFRTSWILLRSFPAAEGLISSLFLREEYAKALIVANDVLKVAGASSAQAWALHGRVAMKDPKTRDQAHKDLEKAIQLDENCVYAIVSLAEWHGMKKDFIKAQQLYVGQ